MKIPTPSYREINTILSNISNSILALYNIHSKRDALLTIIERFKNANIYSTIPVAGYPTSLQSATYYDGEYLHVWYGSAPASDQPEQIYYTKARKPFTTWTTPTPVITPPSGWSIRDPTSLITDNYVYLFIQPEDIVGAKFRSIRLYRVSRTADFSDPNNYEYIGIMHDIGGPGEYDEYMVASPVPINIGGLQFVLYEAMGADGSFSIGILYSPSITTVPYSKLDVVRRLDGTPLRNPVSPTNAIVPCNFITPYAFFIHYYDGATWHLGIAVGDIFANRFALIHPVDPADNYPSHVAPAVVGIIDDYLYILGDAFGPHTLAIYRVYVGDIMR